MSIYIKLRHYIDSEENLKSLEESVKELTFVVNKHPDFRFMILVNYEPLFIKGRLGLFSKTLKMLVARKIEVFINQGFGPGAAILKGIFDFMEARSIRKKGPIIFLIDGDQFDISDNRLLDGIQIMHDELINQNCLIGLGARNKIVLSNEFELNELRKIEEMYYAAFFEKKLLLRNPLKIGLDEAPLSYLEMGDPIPGFYALNCGHELFLNLLSRVYNACVLSDLTGYAGDPYLSLTAIKLSRKIHSIYVPTREALPGKFRMEDITVKTKQISKTDLGEDLFRIVKEGNVKNKLAEFYPKENVEKVCDLIIEGLTRNN